MYRYPKSHRGFTLVEMIVVMVITGIIGGMVAMLIHAPVQGYVDSARRAEMSDIADTARGRLGRDLRTAVPNSVRTPSPAGSTDIEFLPTRDGGRYRVDRTNGAGGCAAVLGNSLGDALNFDAADACFEIVGSPITFSAGDSIVVCSTQSTETPPYCKLNVKKRHYCVIHRADVVMIAAVALARTTPSEDRDNPGVKINEIERVRCVLHNRL